MIEGIEGVADVAEDVATILSAVVAGISDDVQLDEEQLFELQTDASPFEVFGVLGVVDVAQGLVAPHQVVGARDEVGDGLWQGRQLLQHGPRQLLDVARGKSTLLHLLRRGVVGLQTHRGEFERVGSIHVRMGDVDAVVEDRGFAEDHVFYADPITLLGVFATLEPYEVGDARTIGEMGHDTFLARSHLEGLETEDMTHDLYEGHVASEFVDGIDLGTIDILIGVELQQVAVGVDAEFVAQYLLTVRSYARQVLYVLIEDVHG